MTNKLPEDKKGLIEVTKNSWLLISILSTIVIAITSIYNYYKLWQGDQATITIITVAIGLLVLIAILLQLSFGKINVIGKNKSGRSKKQNNKKFKYSLKVRRISQAFLATTLIAAIAGIIFLQRQRAELANKVVVAIATFDGPEEKYKMRTQIIEQLNSSLADFNDIKVIPLTETIKVAQGSEEARKIGQQYQADIVLWGWYAATENPNLTLHIENLSSQKLDVLQKTNTIKPHATLADLESFSLQQQIGKETSGLITFLAGYFQFLSGDYEAAIIRFDQIVNRSEWPGELGINQFDVYFFRGNAYSYLGKYDQAIADFNQTIQINPQFAKSYTDRGSIYVNLGKYEQAITDFDQAIQIGPQDIVTYNNRGIAYTHLGKNDQAIADFNQAIQINPKYAEAYNNRGSSYGQLGKYDQAIVDFNQAILINPLFPDIYNNRGLAYSYLDQYDQAIADFNLAIQINPKSGDAYYNRGTTYEMIGKYEQALADLNQAIQINLLSTETNHINQSILIDPPGAEKYYIHRAIAYTHLGQYEQAIADYSRAIQINPQDIAAYSNRGMNYGWLGKYEEALADFNQAIQIDPQDATVYYDRGIAYDLMNQYERAIADYTQAIQINLQYADAYNNRGVDYGRLGEYEQAIADFAQVIQINPQDSGAYNNRGNSYNNLGKYEEALADYTQAIRINPQDASAYYNRGNIYQALGQNKEAESDFQKYKELTGKTP